MNLPSHIANAPTPMTDAEWVFFSEKGHVNHDLIFRHARDLERIIIWQQDVMENMAEINLVYAELCKQCEGAAVVAVSTGRYYKRTYGFLVDYFRLKQALDDMKKGMG